MRRILRALFAGLMLVVFLSGCNLPAFPPQLPVWLPKPLNWPNQGTPVVPVTGATSAPFTFALAGNMRHFSGTGTYDNPKYFRGAVDAIALLERTRFMISPGDIDPPANTLWTIQHDLGSLYTWYPVVGNSDLPGQGDENYPGANLDWLNTYNYENVNPGPKGCPKTTYSFDYEDAHYVVLNEYCDANGEAATSGDIPDHLYTWLALDLSKTSQRYIFIIGHEPAYPQPDADTGTVRYLSDGLNQYPSHRDRFWRLLQARDVTAYICGHTYSYSLKKIDGVWQLDVGHAAGMGDNLTPSTFILVHVRGGSVVVDAYRSSDDDLTYTLAHRTPLTDTYNLFLPGLNSSQP
jgi:hypothetical protein